MARRALPMSWRGAAGWLGGAADELAGRGRMALRALPMSWRDAAGWHGGAAAGGSTDWSCQVRRPARMG